MIVALVEYVPTWAIVVGAVGLAALAAILVFGGRHW